MGACAVALMAIAARGERDSVAAPLLPFPFFFQVNRSSFKRVCNEIAREDSGVLLSSRLGIV